MTPARFDLLRMRIKCRARDHGVIFVVLYALATLKCCGFTVLSTCTQSSTDKQQPLEKLSSELIVLASRSTTERVVVKSIKLWRRPLALRERRAKKTTTMKTFAGPSARSLRLPVRRILTRRRSYVPFKTTSREYRSISDEESKMKSTKASNQVRLDGDCLHTFMS